MQNTRVKSSFNGLIYFSLISSLFKGVQFFGTSTGNVILDICLLEESGIELFRESTQITLNGEKPIYFLESFFHEKLFTFVIAASDGFRVTIINIQKELSIRICGFHDSKRKISSMQIDKKTFELVLGHEDGTFSHLKPYSFVDQ
jgi:hypothetical protein